VLALHASDLLSCTRFMLLFVDTDVCAGLPCWNGGTCEAVSANSFRCRCREGYTGSLCERSEAFVTKLALVYTFLYTYTLAHAFIWKVIRSTIKSIELATLDKRRPTVKTKHYWTNNTHKRRKRREVSNRITSQQYIVNDVLGQSV